jgi:hypothetical protein
MREIDWNSQWSVSQGQNVFWGFFVGGKIFFYSEKGDSFIAHVLCRTRRRKTIPMAEAA